MRNAILVLGVLLAYVMPASAQEIFVPLMGGGVAVMGQGTISPRANPYMTPMAPMQPLQGGYYGTPSNPGPITPIRPIMPMGTPCGGPYSGGGFGSF